MGIRFACHLCDHKLNIKSDLAGRRGICPACSGRFRIPLQDAEKSTPIENHSTPDPDAESSSESVATEAPAVSVAEPKSPEPPDPNDPESPIAANEQNTILDEDDDGNWYVRPPSGGQYGPATTELLKQWIGEGRVAATSLLWRDGWPQWRDASEALPELVEKLPPNDPPTTPPAAVRSAPSAAKSFRRLSAELWYPRD